MNRTRAAVLLSFFVALGACDGGSRGSGITTAEGNVESVETALRRSPRGGARAVLARLGRLLADAGSARAQAALEGSSLHDASGAAVACETLREGDALRLVGAVDADGTFGEADLTVER